MEPRELMTKRRIEKLASEYENYEEVLSVSDPKDGGFEVFVSHSSADNDFP